MRARFRCRLAVVVERKAVNTIESRRRVKQAYCRRSRRWIALLWRLLEQFPKLDVAGSTPVARSREFEELDACALQAARRWWRFGGCLSRGARPITPARPRRRGRRRSPPS